MSFLLDTDDLLEVGYNDFLENLQLENWRLDSEDGVEIKGKPNLDDIVVYKEAGKVKFQARDIYRRSFYWYMGSDTIPPCKEEVFRFVFENPILIPPAQLLDLKEKTYLTEMEPIGNRKHRHPVNKRVIYYHEDRGKKCAENEFDLMKLEKDIGYEKEKIKYATLDLSHIKPTYLKASAITTTYAVHSSY